MWTQIRWLTITIASISLLAASAPAQNLKPGDSFGESEYRLGPEDVISVFVWKEEDLSVTTVIRPDGKITVPLVGELIASNKTARELQDEIQTKLTKFLASPTTNIVVKEVNNPKISVFGEVKKPDIYRIKQKTTVLDAIAVAGGFTEFAKRNRVAVIRTGPSGPESFQLNLDSMLKGGGTPVFFVQPGDTVYVR
jgi:polysaccharide export outer membrane protein